ncbi:hypothetical protein OAA_10270 [Vibrio cyclitrophicus 1F175]|uniref:hypothetical protein n=1 Tax=Vibrio cyclitrophicus TaxID=47951 RepID=UPI0002D3127D|nr:hypothetical protein [Vibrio cyclitrophicus]OEF64768.1 hypothetical protein OAA_10270 [Vibrio cyclitrophicus 1F175]PMH75831.1 hypothetical protein BCU60_21135 [Vibrio cyclitrophicus]
MKTLLINASAAKLGGAKTVVEKFINEADFSGYDSIFLLAPSEIIVNRKGVKHIILSTSGLRTFLFSTFGVMYFALKLRANTILSFNNINLLIPLCKRITYFHQFLSLSQKKVFPLAPTLIRWTLKYLTYKTLIVVQTQHVKSNFITRIGKRNDILICWPGYNSLDNCEKHSLNLEKGVGTKYAFLPITNCSQKHRNFALILDKKDFFVSNNIKLVMPNSDYIDSEFIINVDYITKFQMGDFLSKIDFLIFPSLEETIGLPLYEVTGYGKPALVLNRPYIEESPVLEKRKDLIYLFEENNIEDIYKSMDLNVKHVNDNLNVGDWSFLKE